MYYVCEDGWESAIIYSNIKHFQGTSSDDNRRSLLLHCV